MDYVSVEVPSSSTCNLDCKYCYIPKSKYLSEIDKKWGSILKKGIYKEILSELYGFDKLSSFSLWGGEPSLGFKNFKDINDYRKYFVKLDSFSTSTNLTTYMQIVGLINELEKLGKKYQFNIQISIDGPDVIQIENRGCSSGKLLNKNLLDFIEKISHIKYGNISIYNKSTNTIENFKNFINDTNLLREYYYFFKNLEEKFKEKSSNTIFINLISSPTLGLPGRYSTEDGKIYSDFLNIDKKIQEEVYHTYNNVYLHRLIDLRKKVSLINISYYNDTFMCSAGVAQRAIDMEGRNNLCHGGWWFNYPGYTKEIFESGEFVDWKEGSRILDLKDENWLSRLSKIVSSSYRDTLNETRVNYLIRSKASLHAQSMASAYAMVVLLSQVGQISKIYSKDLEMAKLLSAFIVIENNCWFNNKIETNSLTMPSLSIFKIFGNGVFEFLIEVLKEKYNGK